MTEKEALRFPIIRAFALQAWKLENNPWCSVERVGAGYVGQEARRRLNPRPSTLST